MSANEYDKILRLRVHTSEPPDFFPNYLQMFRGVRKIALHELPGGYIAVEVGISGATDEKEATEFAHQICDTLTKFDTVYDAVLEYIYSEQEQVVERVKWLGQDALEDIIAEVDGETFIRVDYFLHAMSFEDLGLLDRDMRQQITNFLNGWSQRAQARDAVPRVRAYYDRVQALREYLDAKEQRVVPDEAGATA